MLRIIEGMPPNVLAIEATGKVTHADYQNTLIPKAEAMMANRPIRMLYVVSKDTAFELEALWDDGRFGLTHWHDFDCIAVVGDQAWLRTTMSMFAPFFHGEARMFGLSELDAAKAWIVERKQTAA